MITAPSNVGLTPWCWHWQSSFKVRVISHHRCSIEEKFLELAGELDVEALEVLEHFMLESVVLLGLPIRRALYLFRDLFHPPREVNFEFFDALCSKLSHRIERALPIL